MCVCFWNSAPEPQILDYQTQQHKLLPLLATTYAFHFIGNYVSKMYQNISESVDAGNYSQLNEVNTAHFPVEYPANLKSRDWML